MYIMQGGGNTTRKVGHIKDKWYWHALHTAILKWRQYMTAGNTKDMLQRSEGKYKKYSSEEWTQIQEKREDT